MKFYPEEIIFAATEACNLHCPHCFVKRNPDKLNITDAVNFLESCKKLSGLGIGEVVSNGEIPSIQKIGFSGGEPFLYIDFILALVKYGVGNDLMFDQIMTNGDWWKGEDVLRDCLKKIFDAGYDGKIGLSWDIFHGQKTERMITFINAVFDIFGEDSLNIQFVEPAKGLFSNGKSAGDSNDKIDKIDKKAYEAQLKDIKKAVKEFSIPFYVLQQSFPSKNPLAWQGKKWFSEDYCQGPGHILYIHPTGDIAPCCGFANENPELFIGKITDSFETVLNNAKSNKMVKICYEEGLSSIAEAEIKAGKTFPGKCSDICTFCDYACNNYR